MEGVSDCSLGFWGDHGSHNILTGLILNVGLLFFSGDVSFKGV